MISEFETVIACFNPVWKGVGFSTWCSAKYRKIYAILRAVISSRFHTVKKYWHLSTAWMLSLKWRPETCLSFIFQWLGQVVRTNFRCIVFIYNTSGCSTVFYSANVAYLLHKCLVRFRSFSRNITQVVFRRQKCRHIESSIFSLQSEQQCCLSSTICIFHQCMNRLSTLIIAIVIYVFLFASITIF